MSKEIFKRIKKNLLTYCKVGSNIFWASSNLKNLFSKVDEKFEDKGGSLQNHVK